MKFFSQPRSTQTPQPQDAEAHESLGQVVSKYSPLRIRPKRLESVQLRYRGIRYTQ